MSGILLDFVIFEGAGLNFGVLANFMMFWTITELVSNMTSFGMGARVLKDS